MCFLLALIVYGFRHPIGVGTCTDLYAHLVYYVSIIRKPFFVVTPILSLGFGRGVTRSILLCSTT